MQTLYEKLKLHKGRRIVNYIGTILKVAAFCFTLLISIGEVSGSILCPKTRYLTIIFLVFSQFLLEMLP